MTAGDNAARSNAEERRKCTAGDNAARSNAEERRKCPAGDDAARSNAEVGARPLAVARLEVPPPACGGRRQ
jgi:hypothetical protein